MICGYNNFKTIPCIAPAQASEHRQQWKNYRKDIEQ